MIIKNIRLKCVEEATKNNINENKNGNTFRKKAKNPLQINYMSFIK